MHARPYLSSSYSGPLAGQGGQVFTASITNADGVAVTAIGGSGLSVPGTATVIPASGLAVGVAGFAATDSGFSGGTLQPGQHASYTLDLRLAPQAVSGSIVVRVSVPRVFVSFAKS